MEFLPGVFSSKYEAATMSWKGFKKAVARMPQSIGIGGSSSETKDDEFEQMSLHFNELERLAKKLWDDAKRFKDSLQMMLAHQSEIAQAFVDIFGSDGDNPASPDYNNIAYKFSIAMKEANQNLSGDLEKIERLVVAPTGMYL